MEEIDSRNTIQLLSKLNVCVRSQFQVTSGLPSWSETVKSVTQTRPLAFKVKVGQVSSNTEVRFLLLYFQFLLQFLPLLSY